MLHDQPDRRVRTAPAKPPRRQPALSPYRNDHRLPDSRHHREWRADRGRRDDTSFRCLRDHDPASRRRPPCAARLAPWRLGRRRRSRHPNPTAASIPIEVARELRATKAENAALQARIAALEAMRLKAARAELHFRRRGCTERLSRHAAQFMVDDVSRSPGATSCTPGRDADGRRARPDAVGGGPAGPSVPPIPARSRAGG